MEIEIEREGVLKDRIFLAFTEKTKRWKPAFDLSGYWSTNNKHNSLPLFSISPHVSNHEMQRNSEEAMYIGQQSGAVALYRV